MVDAGYPRAFEEALTRLRSDVEDACARRASWAQGVAAAIVAALDLGVSEPLTMRTLTVDIFDRGTAGALRYQDAVAHFVALLAEGRKQRTDGDDLPLMLEEALVGAVASPIAEAVRMGREAALPELAPELVEFVLSPYLGTRDAKRIAADPR